MGKLNTARTLYGTQVPMKAAVDVFCFIGNSLCDGYAANWEEMSAGDQAKYTPVGDIAGIYRYDNNTLELGSASSKLPILLNRAYNKSTLTKAFGNETCCGVDAKESGQFSNPIYIHCYYVNGVAMMNGDQAQTFSPLDAGGHWVAAMKDLYYFLRYLYFTGLQPTIRIVNFGGQALLNSNHTEEEYRVGIYDMINDIRTRWQFKYGGTENIPFLFGKPDSVAISPDGPTLRGAVDLVTDDRFDYFDYQTAYPLAGDGVHLRTHGTRSFGKYVASSAIHFKTGNALPVVTNPALVGLLKVNENLTVSYNYADVESNPEGDTEYYFSSADDAQGTNEIYRGMVLKGGILNVNIVFNNKYLLVRIVPVSSVGSIRGKAVEGVWQGPVTL